MNDDMKELARYRFLRAQETIEVAEDLLRRGHFRDSNNRSYYAAFYAIRSVYALKGVDFKKHKTLIATFNKEYVASEIFPRSIGKGLSMLQLIREQSDYDDMYVASRQESEMQLSTASELIHLVEVYLKNQGVEIQ